MTHLIRSKFFISFMIAAFVLFVTPIVRAEEANNTADLVGFIYAEDGTTPVEGAVCKVKNITTNKVYESTKTDMLGLFKIEGMEEGVYLAGVNAGDKAYIVKDYFGVKANSTAKIALALKEGQTVELPKGSDKYNFFTFLGFSGNAAISVLLAIVLVGGIVLAAALGVGEKEASPFK